MGLEIGKIPKNLIIIVCISKHLCRHRACIHVSTKNLKSRSPLRLKDKAQMVWDEKIPHVMTCFSSMAEKHDMFLKHDVPPKCDSLAPVIPHAWPRERIPKLLKKLEPPGVISTMFVPLPSSLRWSFCLLISIFRFLTSQQALFLRSLIITHPPTTTSAVTCSTNSTISDPEKLVKTKHRQIFSLTSSCFQWQIWNACAC